MSIDISGLLSFLFGAGLLLGIILLIRGITLWYFKIDIHIYNQERIIDNQKKTNFLLSKIYEQNGGVLSDEHIERLND
ncbi:MAG TPA: hypothetical protein VN040_26295 [Pseudosphingobacterium sp.]|nr:hypothetical protein [Pseudosphingobacterium sp.]